jgi:hypothetical protein
MSRKIKNAYDAWWFLYHHPKFQIPERIEVRDEEHAKALLANATFDKVFDLTRRGSAYRIVKDKGGNLWAVCKGLHRHAVQENLSIHYTKTNKPGGNGTVDDDKTKNKHIECWLEFGSLIYDYSADWEWQEDHKREYLQHVHDPELDTGGRTFDEALVNLAKLVLKFYGDYKDKK